VPFWPSPLEEEGDCSARNHRLAMPKVRQVCCEARKNRKTAKLALTRY
jgi:hypothetical protein